VNYEEREQNFEAHRDKEFASQACAKHQRKQKPSPRAT
jgi:hypothetical protein